MKFTFEHHGVTFAFRTRSRFRYQLVDVDFATGKAMVYGRTDSIESAHKRAKVGMVIFDTRDATVVR